MPYPKLRIFAGPNGSGKSTIIKAVREYRTSAGRPLELGKYVNADDIVQILVSDGSFKLAPFKVSKSKNTFHAFVRCSGLIRDKFTWNVFESCHNFHRSGITMADGCTRGTIEALAQVLAAYLVEELMTAGRSLSFETVFSHESKLQTMRHATENGYRVYLYFVATESPIINIGRVANRVKMGGHAVPEGLITSRYHRSLGLLHSAVEASYHSYLFDNSREQSRMFAKYRSEVKSRWEVDLEDMPNWFYTHYIRKLKPTG